MLLAPVAAYLDARAAETHLIDAPRSALLGEFARFIAERRHNSRPVRLIFVCTHNSRRSHLAHLWAAAAARRLGLTIDTFSGGTEATAFNPRAVDALRRAGLDIDPPTPPTPADNPRYLVRLADDAQPIPCFSKRYTDAPNPRDDFAAVMVCDTADAACPAVPGAAARFAIPFRDPKESDGTPQESAVYDERCRQIAREMLYALTLAAAQRT